MVVCENWHEPIVRRSQNIHRINSHAYQPNYEKKPSSTNSFITTRSRTQNLLKKASSFHRREARRTTNTPTSTQRTYLQASSLPSITNNAPSSSPSPTSIPIFQKPKTYQQDSPLLTLNRIQDRLSSFENLLDNIERKAFVTSPSVPQPVSSPTMISPINSFESRLQEAEN